MEYKAFLCRGTRCHPVDGGCWGTLFLAQQAAITSYASRVLTGDIIPDVGVDNLVIYGYEDPRDDAEVGLLMSKFDPATCAWVRK